MLIVRYRDAPGERVGVLAGEPGESLAGGRVALASLHPLPVAGLSELLALPLDDLRASLERAVTGAPVGGPGDAELLAPIDGRAELWAAGVTYERSRSARVAESERAATVYEQVYDAERPELFMKAAAWRVVGPGGTATVRADSQVDVPEPELAVVVNARGEIVGYSVCDDLSSRTIEGENPLYLPQAKVWDGAAVLGPGIRPAWEVPDPHELAMRLVITRERSVVWEGESSTGLLHRRVEDLVAWLLACTSFPDGAVLSTGTALVPDLPFTLAVGDVVDIEVASVGRLRHDVVRRQVRPGRLGGPLPGHAGRLSPDGPGGGNPGA